MCKIDLDNRVARYGDEWSTVHCFLQPICNGSTQEWICIGLSDGWFFPQGWRVAMCPSSACRLQEGANVIVWRVQGFLTVFSLYHLARLMLILVRSWPVSSQKCMLVPHLQERVQQRGGVFNCLCFATFSHHFDVSTHRLFGLRINTIMTCFFFTVVRVVPFAKEAHRCCTSRLQGGLPVPGDMRGTRKWSCISMAGGMRTSPVTCDA